MAIRFRKKTVIFVTFLTLGILLFVSSVYSSGIENIIEVLKQFSLLKFIFFVAISFLNFALYSLRWEIITKTLYSGHKIPSSTFFWNRMASFAISYMTPTAQVGGEPLRIMLIEEEGVPRKEAISSTIIDKALEISVLIIFISCGILVGLLDGNLLDAHKVILASGSTFLLLLVFWFYYSSIKNIGFLSSIFKVLPLKRYKRLHEWSEKISVFEREMNLFYHKNGKALYLLIFISVLTVLFILLEHFLVAWFMGVKLTFIQAFLSSTIPYFSYLLPVPGGLGVLESGHASIFAIMGVSINAFAFVFIIRLRDFIFVLLGLIRGWHRGLQIIKKEFQEDFSVEKE